MPLIIEEKRKKREKLLHYVGRVWNITEGDDDSRIDSAIIKTREFFKDKGFKTHLSDYGITSDKTYNVLTMIRNRFSYLINKNFLVSLNCFDSKL